MTTLNTTDYFDAIAFLTLELEKSTQEFLKRRGIKPEALDPEVLAMWGDSLSDMANKLLIAHGVYAADDEEPAEQAA